MENASHDNNPVSKDSFYNGKVTVYQYKKGFRFSVDAPILADFIPYSKERALEIGVGSGIISLLLMKKGKIPFINGIEIQKNLKELSEMNVNQNGFSEKIQISQGDFRKQYRDYTGIKLVFSNPPFFPYKNGRMSDNEEIRYAKGDEKLSLSELLPLVYKILGPHGSFYLILPYQRLVELGKLADKAGFFTARFREIYPYHDRKANRFLIQLTNYKVKTITEKPLIIYKSENCYSDEIQKIISG